MTRLPLAALLSLWIAAPALAADDAPTDAPDTPEASEDAPKKRIVLFPPFKRRHADDGADDADQATSDEEVHLATGDGVDEEAPAADEAPAEGIWEWVGRMDGEIPSDEQVQAIEELAETEDAERSLIDELSGAHAPTDFYKDPVGALTVDPLYLDRVDPSEFDIPIVVNDEVRKWVKYFTGPGRKYYTRWLGRSTRYRPMMYQRLEEHGLPRDLVYLSMIESGYNAHAYSHASAAGLWQFIPSTARLYKLRVDWWVDERRDPEHSLEAAIDFLDELHTMFGDWQLAWAAYNTGPGRVRRSVEKAGTKDFFTIARGNYLHPETENYVPKIMAAAIIGKHPERYGFTDIAYQEVLDYDVAKVDGTVELSVLAKCAGTDVATIQALNPSLRRYATPPEGTMLRLPKGKAHSFSEELAKVPQSKRVTVVKHTVQRGQTLSAIASRYGVSVSSISQANNLKNVNRITVGMTLVIPKHGAAPTTAVASSSSKPASSSRSSASSRPSTYTVRRGDSLSAIASKHGMSVATLKAKNGLRSDTIQVGQTLKLTGSASASSSSTTTTKYTIRRGDTLSSIATRFGVRTSDLQRWNGISNASHIQVGQTLTVKGSASQWKTYSVRSGDSLGKIATNYRCSVSELQQWNNLSGSVIHPGQQLKIRVN